MKILDDEQDKLLDHEYDGIKELDNYMPVWWLWLFYFTIAFGIVYLLYYEVLDWGMDQHELYQAEVAAAEQKYGAPEEEGPPPEEFEWTVLTSQEDIDAGKELFNSANQLCATCHAQNLGGSVGPNLTDDMWIHGCSPKEIAMSIVNGYPARGMQPYGSGTKISNEKVQQLVSFIISKQGSDPANAKAVDETRAKPCEVPEVNS